MGASISFDSKYRLVLDTEVECISVSPPNVSTAHKNKNKKHNHQDRTGGGGDSASDSDSDSGSGSGSDSASGSDGENKTYTVKITPEITSYVRSYLRKNEFLDEFDIITEIELDNYNHALGTALVFNSDSIVFMANNQTIEAVGEWEYMPPEHPSATTPKSKTKSKPKSKSKNRLDNDNDDDDDDDDDKQESSKYKTKDDDLPVSEIENILKEKFEEYNTSREFIIHESKNSFLCLKINSVEIVKA